MKCFQLCLHPLQMNKTGTGSLFVHCLAVFREDADSQKGDYMIGLINVSDKVWPSKLCGNLLCLCSIIVLSFCPKCPAEFNQYRCERSQVNALSYTSQECRDKTIKYMNLSGLFALSTVLSMFVTEEKESILVV